MPRSHSRTTRVLLAVTLFGATAPVGIWIYRGPIAREHWTYCPMRIGGAWEMYAPSYGPRYFVRALQRDQIVDITPDICYDAWVAGHGVVVARVGSSNDANMTETGTFTLAVHGTNDPQRKLRFGRTGLSWDEVLRELDDLDIPHPPRQPSTCVNAGLP